MFSNEQCVHAHQVYEPWHTVAVSMPANQTWPRHWLMTGMGHPYLLACSSADHCHRSITGLQARIRAETAPSIQWLKLETVLYGRGKIRQLLAWHLASAQQEIPVCLIYCCRPSQYFCLCSASDHQKHFCLFLG